MNNGFMLDTNVFDHIVKGQVDPEVLRGKKLFVTHIQRDEMQNTPDAAHREKLLQFFHEVMQEQLPTATMASGISTSGNAAPGGSGMVHTSTAVVDISVADCASAGGGMIPTSSAVWGTSNWGQAYWTSKDDGDLFQAMRDELNALSKRRGNNNTKDILIAETALRRGLVLVTDDRPLTEVAKKFGLSCVTAPELGLIGTESK